MDSYFTQFFDRAVEIIGEEEEMTINVAVKKMLKIFNSSDEKAKRTEAIAALVKKPKTAKELFAEQVMEDVKADNPKAKKSEINKIISEMWEEIKKEDEETAQELEKEALEKKVEHNLSLGKKAPSTTKKALSAYNYFCADAEMKKRAKETKGAGQTLLGRLAEMWRKIKDSKDEEDIELKQKFVSMTGKTESYGSESDDRKGKKARTAYMLFAQYENDRIKKQYGSDDIKKKIAEEWMINKDGNTDMYRKYVEIAEKEKKEYNESNGIEEKKKKTTIKDVKKDEKKNEKSKPKKEEDEEEKDEEEEKPNKSSKGIDAILKKIKNSK